MGGVNTAIGQNMPAGGVVGNINQQANVGGQAYDPNAKHDSSDSDAELEDPNK